MSRIQGPSTKLTERRNQERGEEAQGQNVPWVMESQEMVSHLHFFCAAISVRQKQGNSREVDKSTTPSRSYHSTNLSLDHH